MNKPLPKVTVRRGGVVKFEDNVAVVDLTALTGDSTPVRFPIPAPLLPRPEEYSTSPAITQYGSAGALTDLAGMMGEDYVQYRFFHLIALYPDFKKLGYHHSETSSHLILEHGDNKRVLAWWVNDMPETFLCFEEGEDLPAPREDDTKTPDLFNPSELMYALSIMAQHGSMGSDIFAIYNTPERKTVLFNDYEDPTFFMGAYFNPVEQD
ncbi:hypothetical protein [Erwinia phage vB_Ea277G]|jgi:hypothetical protein|nr:hypothetical protein [Erwinia phage vB_Ea277G]